MRDLFNIVFRVSYLAMSLIGSLLIVGCGGAPEGEAGARRLTVAVSILPQAEFVQRIAGGTVDTVVMIPPGASPATYEPKPQQIQALAGCALYFTIGVPFEDAWLVRLRSANPGMVVVDTAAGIQRLRMASHSHDDHGEADHDGAAEPVQEEAEEAVEHLDPHIWLSPRLVKIQAANITRALCDLSPENADRFQEGLRLFLVELDTVDGQIRERLRAMGKRKFMVFHPAWGYFAQEYGLEMIPVEVGGQEPSGAELAAFVDVARAEGLKVILAQPEFSTRSVETLAREIGGRVLPVSPLGLPWAENLLKVADTFAQELRAPAMSGEVRRGE